MPRRDVAQHARVRLDQTEEESQELSRRRVTLQMPVDLFDQLYDGLRVVDLEVHGRVDRGHEQGRGHAFPGHVGHQESQAPPREGEEVVVIPSDMARRKVRGGQLQSRDFRQRTREDFPLDRGRELELPLDALLFDRLAVQARRLDRGGRLIGEEREQASVRGREVEHPAVARLLVRDREEAQPPALHRDRDGEALLTRRQTRAGGRNARGGVVDDRVPLGQRPGRELARRQQLAPQAPLEEDLPALVEKHQRALARVRQRDRAEEHLIGERREVELPGKREAEVVEGFELEQSGPDLEIRLLDQPRQAMRRDLAAEDEREERSDLVHLFGGDSFQGEMAVHLSFRGERDPEGSLAVRRRSRPRLRRLRHRGLARQGRANPGLAVAHVERRAAGSAPGERRFAQPGRERSLRPAGQRRAEGLPDLRAPESGRRDAVAHAPRPATARARRASSWVGKTFAYCASPMIRNVLSMVGVRPQKASSPLRSITLSSTSIKIEIPIELTMRVFSRFKSSARAPESSCAYASRAISSPPWLLMYPSVQRIAISPCRSAETLQISLICISS